MANTSLSSPAWNLSQCAIDKGLSCALYLSVRVCESMSPIRRLSRSDSAPLGDTLVLQTTEVLTCAC